MRLDVTAPDAFVFLELAFRHIERVAQRYVNILVIVRGRVSVADRDLLIRHGDLQMHLEPATVRLVLVRAIDRDAATQDRAAEVLELPRQLARARFNSGRGIEVTEGNLDWHLHGSFPHYTPATEARETR
jgi:hypothetical protein